MTMRIVPIGELRRQLGRIVRAVHEEGDVVTFTRHGRPAIILVKFEQFAGLLAQLEELSDLADLGAAAGEPERDYEAFLATMGAAA